MLRDPTVWIGHITLFYLALVICITALVVRVAHRPAERALVAVAAGLVVGILPPLIDVAVYGVGGFNYTYRFDFFANTPWLLFDPPDSLPAGETAALWLSVALIAAYVRVMGGSWVRVAATVAGHYLLILLFLIVVPSTGFALTRWSSPIHANESVAFALAAAIVAGGLLLRPALAIHLAARLPHVLLAPVLVLVGSALVGRLDGHTAVAAVVMGLTALAFAVANGYYDRREDGEQDRPRVVGRADVVFSATLLVPLWLACSAHFWPVLLAVLFFVVGFAYHADPFRLKCVFPLSYKTESFFALLSLGAGVLTHPRMLVPLESVVALLLVGGGAGLVSMIKDYKDVEADRAAGVATAYVVLLQRGWSESNTHRLVLALASLALLVPPIWLTTRGATTGAMAMLVLAAAVVGPLRLVHNRARATLIGLVALNLYLLTGAAALMS